MSDQKISDSLLRADSDADTRSVLARSEFIRIFIFEMIGAFILSFGIACSQYVPPLSEKTPNKFHDIFVSLSLYLAIVIGAPFCGGHFNPSVTFGFFFLKEAKMSTGKLLTYLFAQTLGAILGVTLAKLFFDCQITPYSESVSFFAIVGHMIGEFLGGFLFIFMILIVTSPQTTFIQDTAWIHIFIPLTLFVARSFSYHIGGVNPAVVSALQLEGVLVKNLPFITFVQVIILDVASVLGAIIASLFYQHVYRPTFKKIQ